MEEQSTNKRMKIKLNIIDTVIAEERKRKYRNDIETELQDQD